MQRNQAQLLERITALNTTVVLTGIFLSMLQFECHNFPSQGDCEGLLFGTAKHISETEVDDSGTRQKDLVEICPFTYVMTRPESRFYDGQGNIIQSRLEQHIHHRTYGDNTQLIGCFKFRRNVLMSPSLRDGLVLDSLQRWIHSSDKSSLFDTKSCVFLLLNFESADEIGSTMTEDVGAYSRSQDTNGTCRWNPLPIRILNLDIFSSNFSHSNIMPLEMASSSALLVSSASQMKEKATLMCDSSLQTLHEEMVSFVHMRNAALNKNPLPDYDMLISRNLTTLNRRETDDMFILNSSRSHQSSSSSAHTPTVTSLVKVSREGSSSPLLANSR